MEGDVIMAVDSLAAQRGGVVLVDGGYDEALDGWDAAARGFGVQVRQIDHRDPATADAILRDVMAGQETGLFATAVRYKGTRPEMWIKHLAPDVLEPRFFGLFAKPSGDLLGWFSLTFSLGNRSLASLGLVLKAAWAGKGLGVAAVRHAVTRKDVLLARPIPILAAVTLPSNDVMIHVLQKAGLIDCGEVPDGGVFKRMFATSSLKW